MRASRPVQRVVTRFVARATREKARSVIEPEVWVIERGSVGICVTPSAWNAGSGAGAEAWASFGASAPPGAGCVPLLEVGCVP